MSEGEWMGFGNNRDGEVEGENEHQNGLDVFLVLFVKRALDAWNVSKKLSKYF